MTSSPIRRRGYELRDATPELLVRFSQHTWFRRNRRGVDGIVVCVVRSSLLPVLSPDQPDDTEMLLSHLGAPSFTVAVCYRPPDGDIMLDWVMSSLERWLIVVGDFNLLEISWTQRPAAALPTCSSAHGTRSWTRVRSWDD